MKISIAEHQQRRQRLLEKLPNNCVAIIASATLKLRNHDVDYPFRQDSDFFYLTGFNEADAFLILSKAANGDTKSSLFCLPRDPARELWDGYRCGPEQACERFAVDEAFENTKFKEKLVEILDGQDAVYYLMGAQTILQKPINQAIQTLRSKIRAGAKVPNNIADLSGALHEMRLIKSPSEIELMRHSANISAKAHNRAMQFCQPQQFEYQLNAEIMHEFQSAGAHLAAYNSIVGGGANACVLHYVENNQQMQDGDLVLIDAGCEYEYYAADITRTFPINGRFSEPQKALYDVVLDAQLATIDKARAGEKWSTLHKTALDVIVDGLIDLGLLKGSREDNIKDKKYLAFYMHGTGHWLGMDVHDVGSYQIDGDSRALKENMVFTIEPGIYVHPDNDTVDERWRGIGIRIEDNICVTAGDADILTSDAVKHRDDIEQLMNR